MSPLDYIWGKIHIFKVFGQLLQDKASMTENDCADMSPPPEDTNWDYYQFIPPNFFFLGQFWGARHFKYPIFQGVTKK